MGRRVDLLQTCVTASAFSLSSFPSLFSLFPFLFLLFFSLSTFRFSLFNWLSCGLNDDRLLGARGEDGKPLDIDYVKAETVFVLIAGTDTTRTAVQSLVHLVLANDRVNHKVMAEVDAATKAGHLRHT